MINGYLLLSERFYTVLARSRLQKLISSVGLGQENAIILLVYQHGLLKPDTACLLGVYGLSW